MRVTLCARCTSVRADWVRMSSCNCLLVYCWYLSSHPTCVGQLQLLFPELMWLSCLCPECTVSAAYIECMRECNFVALRHLPKVVFQKELVFSLDSNGTENHKAEVIKCNSFRTQTCKYVCKMMSETQSVEKSIQATPLSVGRFSYIVCQICVSFGRFLFLSLFFGWCLQSGI